MEHFTKVDTGYEMDSRRYRVFSFVQAFFSYAQLHLLQNKSFLSICYMALPFNTSYIGGIGMNDNTKGSVIVFF